MRSLLALLAILMTASLVKAEDSKYRDLPKERVEVMAKQRAAVTALISRSSLNKLTGTRTDYETIQDMISKKLVSKSDTAMLESLGVVFGDTLISEEPRLKWMEVTDQWGTGPVLIFDGKHYQLSAVDMLARKVEGDEPGSFVEALARTVLSLARENGPKARKL